MEGYEKYVGAVLDGRYKIEKIIGIGGMAVVYKAHDMLMNRPVAVKMLKDEIAGDEESVKRFVNESKAVAMMSHRNIVSIYDVSVRDDVKYIVMEYIEGITLRNYMSKRGQLTLREIISYTEQILLALSHAHSKGIVHRDIKPQNIMLLKNGIIKVTDFGIAKLPNAETVTMTDKAIGTVYYISPEQASGQPIDRRSDLYSLGVMMYEMATGELPFTADSPVSVAMMQINDTARAPGELNRRLKENPNVVFRIPKHREDGESKGILSLLSGGGPMFPVIAAVALAFIIVFSVGTVYVLGRVADAMSNVSQTITVKEFVGNIYTDELANALDASDEYKVSVEYVYSEEYEPGLIIEQDPKAGSTRKIVKGEQKCEVTLTVCSGQKEVTVPDLLGLDRRSAELQLRKLSLKAAIEYKKSNEYSSGQVVEISPAAGEKISIGETVTVYICGGSEEGDVKVPDFVGMTEKEAFAKLIELDLLPGKVTYVKDKAERGTVISQGEEKGSKVAKYTKISFKVSGGPDFDPENPDATKPETTVAETTKKPETSKKPETTEPVTTEETTEPVTTEAPDSDTTGDDSASSDIIPADADT